MASRRGDPRLGSNRRRPVFPTSPAAAKRRRGRGEENSRDPIRWQQCGVCRVGKGFLIGMNCSCRGARNAVGLDLSSILSKVTPSDPNTSLVFSFLTSQLFWFKLCSSVIKNHIDLRIRARGKSDMMILILVYSSCSILLYNIYITLRV
jgi:hypothetical protein